MGSSSTGALVAANSLQPLETAIELNGYQGRFFGFIIVIIQKSKTQFWYITIVVI
jgi:hypothetical protein